MKGRGVDRRSTAIVLGAVATLLVMGNMLPWPPRAQMNVYLCSVAVSVAFVLAATRTVAKSRQGPYRLILWAVATWLIGTAVFVYYRIYRPDLFPTPADPLLIGGYIPLVLAVRRLQDRSRETFGSVIDAAIVAAAAAVVSFVFVMMPRLTDSQLGVGARLIGSIYPLIDVVLLFLVVTILMHPGRRTRALWWLMAALISTMSGDVIQNVVVIGGGNTYPGVAYLGWSLFYVLLGVSALSVGRDPDVAVANPVHEAGRRDGTAGLTVSRLIVLALAAMLPSALLMFTEIKESDGQDVYLGAGSLLLIAMVVARIWDLLLIMRSQAKQLDRTARTDPLTGVANRRSWDFELARSMQRSIDEGCLLLVGLLDLDHFKRYNDTHGHQQGDDLLREAARSWSLALTSHGRIARWGGEEFAVVVNTTDVDEGLAVIDGLRARVPFGQTCSIGVARWVQGQDATDPLR